MSRTFVNHKQVTIDYLTELENNIKLDIAKMINAKYLFTENRKLIFELPGEKKIRVSLRFTEKKLSLKILVEAFNFHLVL